MYDEPIQKSHNEDFDAEPTQREDPLDIPYSVKDMIDFPSVFAESELTLQGDQFQYFFAPVDNGTWLCRRDRFDFRAQLQALFPIQAALPNGKRLAIEHFKREYPEWSGPCNFYWTSSMTEAQWLAAWGDELARRILGMCDLIPGSDGKTLKNAACYLANREVWKSLSGRITDGLIVSELQRKPSPYFGEAIKGLRDYAALTLSDGDLGKMAARIMADPDPVSDTFTVVAWSAIGGMSFREIHAVSSHMALINFAATEGFSEDVTVVGCFDDDFRFYPAEEGGTFCYASDFNYKALEGEEGVA